MYDGAADLRFGLLAIVQFPEQSAQVLESAIFAEFPDNRVFRELAQVIAEHQLNLLHRELLLFSEHSDELEKVEVVDKRLELCRVVRIGNDAVVEPLALRAGIVQNGTDFLQLRLHIEGLVERGEPFGASDSQIRSIRAIGGECSDREQGRFHDLEPEQRLSSKIGPSTLVVRSGRFARAPSRRIPAPRPVPPRFSKRPVPPSRRGRPRPTGRPKTPPPGAAARPARRRRWPPSRKDRATNAGRGFDRALPCLPLSGSRVEPPAPALAAPSRATPVRRSRRPGVP